MRCPMAVATCPPSTLARTAYQDVLARLRNGDFATAEEFCAAAEEAVNYALSE